MGTLLAFTTVAISVLVVRYAPPYDMPMKVALAGTPESLISNSGHSEQDEQNLEDPFDNGNQKISFKVYNRNSLYIFSFHLYCNEVLADKLASLCWYLHFAIIYILHLKCLQVTCQQPLLQTLNMTFLVLFFMITEMLKCLS